MVTEILANIDGKIYSISIQIESVDIKIPVYISCLVKSKDPENIGVILELYRVKYLNDISYINNHFPKIIKHISKLSFPFIDFDPDCIVCFYPIDENRKNILKYFKEKMTENLLNVSEIDISDSFKKKDGAISVMSKHLTKDDFELTFLGSNSFKNILIIDDIIDQGRTINIFLELLAEKGLLDKETNVRIVCIYSRLKKFTTMNLKQMLNIKPE
jgi:hypothetical protein